MASDLQNLVARRSAILTELVVYAASALFSFALLGNLLKKLDPNTQATKQARGGAHLDNLSGFTRGAYSEK